MNAGATRQPSLLWPSLIALAAFVVLIGLGLWQLERRVWKETLIEALDARLTAQPVPLPAHDQWAQLDPAGEEFRRVRFTAEFLPAREGRVYTGGSGLRDDIKGPGYFAFAPARLADGSVVVVNRGFVFNPRPDAALTPIALPASVLELVGVMRWPEPPGWFVTSYSTGEELWFVRDHAAMAARYGWGTVPPFYVDQEAPVPAGDVPRPAPLKANLRNEHLQYALTWFGLATVLAIAFAFWARSARRPN